MNMIHAIIIDDEIAGISNLRALVSKYCSKVKIVAECENIIQGKEAIEALKPQIVFLDIEMPFGNGFDLLLSYEKVPFQVIFVTAFEKYALQAIRMSACDYVLKPIGIHDLIAAVDKAVERCNQKSENDNLKLLLSKLMSTEANARIALPTAHGTVFVPLANIIYCEAEASYTWFYFTDRARLLVTKNLGEYEELLSGSGFLRIHHAHLVNAAHITGLVKGNSPTIILGNKVHLSVSQRRKDVLQRYIDEMIK